MALLAFHFPAICLFSFRRRGPRLEVSALWFPCSAHHTARAHQRERENPMCVCACPLINSTESAKLWEKNCTSFSCSIKCRCTSAHGLLLRSPAFSAFFLPLKQHTSIHRSSWITFCPERARECRSAVYKCARVIKLTINRGEHKIKMLQLVAASQNNAHAHTGGPRGKIKCIWQWSGSSPDCEAAAALLFSNRCTCLAASHATWQTHACKASTMHLIIMVMQQSGAFSALCNVASKMSIINPT